MSLKGKSALKVEEAVESDEGTWNITKMWNALDLTFLPIGHRELRYRQFATRHMRHGEQITEN